MCVSMAGRATTMYTPGPTRRGLLRSAAAPAAPHAKPPTAEDEAQCFWLLEAVVARREEDRRGLVVDVGAAAGGRALRAHAASILDCLGTFGCRASESGRHTSSSDGWCNLGLALPPGRFCPSSFPRVPDWSRGCVRGSQGVVTPGTALDCKPLLRRGCRRASHGGVGQRHRVRREHGFAGSRRLPEWLSTGDTTFNRWQAVSFGQQK